MRRRARSFQLYAATAVALPLVALLLVSVRDHDGRVSRLEDFLLLVARQGWQSFTVAVVATTGPVFASVVGTLIGLRVAARPRQAGELTYLVASGTAQYRRVMMRRAATGLMRTVGCIALLIATSVAIGLLAFGSGEFESVSGSPIPSSEVVRIVMHGCLATLCIGVAAFAVVSALGARVSVQAAAAAGLSLLFMEQAVGGLPLLGDAARFLPFGNYNGWTNRLATDLTRGSTNMLYLTTAVWTALSLAASGFRQFATLPRVGGDV